MIIVTIILSIMGAGLGILQSTVFAQLIPFNVVPDLALLLLVSSSWRFGSLQGEITGFVTGMSYDILGLAPLGFHAFIYTLLGYAVSRMKTSFSTGKLVFPALAILLATILKYCLALLLSLIFNVNIEIISIQTLGELVTNIVLAPLVFLVLNQLYNVFGRNRT